MDKKILTKSARTIVSCDGEDRVYRDTDILIKGPKILAIGRDLINGGDPASGRNLNREGVQVIRAEGGFVYPGLIDTHHHSFQTFVRNLMIIDYPNMMIMSWIDKIYHIFQDIDSGMIYYSTLTSFADLMKHGCTCAFDHQYCCTRKAGKSPVDRQVEAAELLDIRYHAGRGTNTLPGNGGSSIPGNMLGTTDEFLKNYDRLIRLCHDSGPFSMRQIVMTPYQPISYRRETFAEAVAMAREKGVRIHTHLGEGEDEGMMTRWGKRAMSWYGETGSIGEGAWYAHNWEVTKGEYKVLAVTGTGVSHCPAPAVLGGFSILDIKEMREVGILVSLGCDGSVASDSSSLLDALRMACLMQANHTKERGGCISAYDMLKMATVNGVETLGRGDPGSLEAGKAVDLFMVDTETLKLANALHDPKNLLARVGLTRPVWITMVDGNIIYKDGILKGMDERKLTMEGEAIYTRIIQEPHSACREFIQGGILFKGGTGRKEERRLADEGIFFYRGIGGAVRT